MDFLVNWTWLKKESLNLQAWGYLKRNLPNWKQREKLRKKKKKEKKKAEQNIQERWDNYKMCNMFSGNSRRKKGTE